MMPIDTLITAVRHHEHVVAMEWSKHHQPPDIELLDKNRAALRATFELVLADLQLADAETIEAVRKLRGQRDVALAANARLTDDNTVLHNTCGRYEEDLKRAEAVSAGLRELATQQARDQHIGGLMEGDPAHCDLDDGANFTKGFLACPHPQCVLVRAPHGQQP